jgi:hypothetical protein
MNGMDLAKRLRETNPSVFMRSTESIHGEPWMMPMFLVENPVFAVEYLSSEAVLESITGILDPRQGEHGHELD